MGLYRSFDGVNAEVSIGVYQDRGLSGLPHTQGYGVLPALDVPKREAPLPGTEIFRYFPSPFVSASFEFR